MPSIDKEGGGITITFAAKNEDVRKLLVEYKRKKVRLTDYICDAIRFYEDNKDKKSDIDEEKIIKIIQDEVEKKLNDRLKAIDCIETKEIKKAGNLEDGLTHVDTTED